jgi:hypothetical protein
VTKAMTDDFLSEHAGKSNEQLFTEAKRAEIAAAMLTARARTEQELALAARIRTATEVEVEDFYDGSGSGGVSVGVDLKTQTGSLGAGGSGRRLVRRIIRLKGWPEQQVAPAEEP